MTNFCVPKLNLGKLNINNAPVLPQKDTSFGDGLPLCVNDDENGVMSFIESAKVSPIKCSLLNQDADLSFEARQTKLVFEDMNKKQFIKYCKPHKTQVNNTKIQPTLKIKGSKIA